MAPHCSTTSRFSLISTGVLNKYFTKNVGFTGGILPIRTQPSPRPDPQVSNQPGPCQDKPGHCSDKPGPCKPDRATSNPRLPKLKFPLTKK